MWITGSGTYRVGGEVALVQQLSLDLRIGRGPVTHFDSGLVGGASSFPGIDLEISMNGGTCLDTVIDLHAKPASRGRGGRADLGWNDPPAAPEIKLQARGTSQRSLLPPDCFDRVLTRGAQCGRDAEDHPDDGADSEGESHSVQGHERLERRCARDNSADRGGKDRSHGAPSERQHHGLGEKLGKDITPPAPDRLPESDLPGSLRHGAVLSFGYSILGNSR